MSKALSSLTLFDGIVDAQYVITCFVALLFIYSGLQNISSFKCEKRQIESQGRPQVDPANCATWKKYEDTTEINDWMP